jgi:hypothetical protein
MLVASLAPLVLRQGPAWASALAVGVAVTAYRVLRHISLRRHYDLVDLLPLSLDRTRTLNEAWAGVGRAGDEL